MQFNVPTFMCKAMLAFDLPDQGWKAGQIVDLPYGVAVTLHAQGGVTALMEPQKTHTEAQIQLKIYGADAWFPSGAQTSSRLAEYLADVDFQTPTAN